MSTLDFSEAMFRKRCEEAGFAYDLPILCIGYNTEKENAAIVGNSDTDTCISIAELLLDILKRRKAKELEQPHQEENQ